MHLSMSSTTHTSIKTTILRDKVELTALRQGTLSHCRRIARSCETLPWYFWVLL